MATQRPRAVLDVLLANRLPGVVVLTASYATELGLEVTALVADFRRFPVDADERRDGVLVAEADAAVVVWDGRDPDVRRVLALIERQGIPLHVIGRPARKNTKR